MEIHHIAFRTRDLPRLERFYIDVLGLRIVRRDGERSVWLSLGRALLMLEAKAEGEPEIPAGSQELVAFSIAPEEHARYMDAWAARGLAVEARTSFTTYLRDPDGRRVAVSSYPAPAVP